MINKRIYTEIINKIKKESFKKNPCFYLYDLNNITEKINLLQKNMPKNVRMLYSIKANPHDKIIEHMKNNSYIKGVEVASLGELNRALKSFNPRDIIFPGPGKTSFEIKSALQKKVGLIVVESYLEALRIQQIAKEERIKSVNVLIRININYQSKIKLNYRSSETQKTCGFSSKLGIDEEKIYSTLDLFKKLDRLVIRGVHVMSGSEELNYKNLLNYFEYVFSLINKLKKSRFEAKIIDFGGGFGIDYESKNKKLDIVSLGREFNNLIKKFNLGKKTIIFELGKYLVGESGYYVTEIIDIKRSMGKWQVITSGGINHIKRPQEAALNHPTSIINLNKPKFYPDQPFVKKEKADIGGPLCTSLDTYCKDLFVDEANIGDLVVTSNLGAYGLTFSPVNFLSHLLPKEYFIK